MNDRSPTLDCPRVLVVAPHADDEVIGCGGTVAKLVRQGASVHVVVVGLGGIHPIEMRMSELHEASEVLGVQRCTVLYPGMDLWLDTIPQVEIVTELDALLEEGYDYVFYPCLSHDQGHRVVQQTCTAALRPGTHLPTPKAILMYENHYPGWVPMQTSSGKLYIDITDMIDVKLSALERYASQLKPYPHPLSVKAVKLIASVRGLEMGVRYAERFHVVQIIGIPGWLT